jgi:hypothetical protein
MATAQRTFVLLVLAALATLFVAGCAGSSGGATTGAGSDASTHGEASNAAETVPGAVAKQVFVDEADAICEAADVSQEKDLSAFTKKHPKAEKEKGAAGKMLVRIGLPPVQGEAEELGELTPPAGDEAALGKIVSGIETAVATAESEAEAVALGKAEPFAAVEKEAAAYGFEACASPL